MHTYATSFQYQSGPRLDPNDQLWETPHLVVGLFTTSPQKLALLQLLQARGGWEWGEAAAENDANSSATQLHAETRCTPLMDHD